MKKQIVITALGLMFACTAVAALYTYDYSVGSAIPDGTATGIYNQQTISGVPAAIQSMNVTINVSGGYNGDLYCYLRHDDNLVVLLNQVGTTSSDSFGYDNTGFQITLRDTAPQISDVHFYQNASYALNGNGQLTGSWRPDGGSLATFNNADANGDWTIFFADLSGGEQSTLVSWGLEITAVPEPVTVALAVFAGLAMVGSFAGWIRRRSRQGERRIS
ncbi:MAG TPA: PEP-CTERM sorting domain-containing protein [Candidatus Limnocylindria bacterium]|nr:PEP-CTERM sorting domain-containing protein [Candidatus Limnocylindria bacterium]